MNSTMLTILVLIGVGSSFVPFLEKTRQDWYVIVQTLVVENRAGKEDRSTPAFPLSRSLEVLVGAGLVIFLIGFFFGDIFRTVVKEIPKQ